LSQHTSLAPGHVVDRYVVLHLLGRGGMSTVYAVRHAILGTRYAMKVLHDASTAQRQRLVDEGRLQARLDPRWVVPVLDVLDLDGAPCLLLPLVEGGTLADLLTDGPLTVDEALLVLGALQRGIACAHRANVVHRDLKPSNVLLDVLDDDVRVRISDFGIAMHSGTDEGGRERLGTPVYAAPEQLAGGSVDHRADLWSLGVILLEMVTGRPGPVDAQRAPETLAALATALLEVRPSDRPTSVVDVELPGLAGRPGQIRRALVDRVGRVRRRRLEQVSASTLEPAPAGNHRRRPASGLRRFVGRAAELRRLAQLTGHPGRPVVLHGSAGVGKTRLSLHHAERFPDAWSGGVHLIEVDPEATIDSLVVDLGRAIGLTNGGDLWAALVCRGHCLVVVDAAEKQPAAVTELVTELTERVGNAVVIVTSRVHLPDLGVHVAIDPMQEADARRLFVDRAADRGVQIDAEDSMLGGLLERLDHLPLTIELAAAQTPRLSLGQLVERLSRNNPSEQPVLDALFTALDASFALLSDEDRSGLVTLSAFRGGFRVEMAEALLGVGGAAVLQRLLEGSWVRALGSGRWAMLESVRAYVARGCDPDAVVAARRTHASAFAQWGSEEALEATRLGRGPAGGPRAMAADRENVSEAFRFCIRDGDVERAGSLACCLAEIADLVGPTQMGLDAIDDALSMPGRSDVLSARLQFVRGRISALLGRPDEALACIETAIAAFEEAGDAVSCARARVGHADVRVTGRDPAAARADVEPLVERLEAAGDALGAADARLVLGRAYGELREYELARRTFESAIAAFERLGDPIALARGRSDLGVALARLGEHELARRSLEAAGLGFGPLRRQSVVLVQLGLLDIFDDRLVDAVTHLGRATELLRATGDLRTLPFAIDGLATARCLIGDLEGALRDYAEALAGYQALGMPTLEATVRTGLARIHTLLGSPGRAIRHLDMAIERLEHPIHLAYAWLGLAAAHRHAGDADRARNATERAIHIAAAVDHPRLGGSVAVEVAEIDLLEGRHDAVRRALAGARADSALTRASWALVRADLAIRENRGEAVLEALRETHEVQSQLGLWSTSEVGLRLAKLLRRWEAQGHSIPNFRISLRST